MENNNKKVDIKALLEQNNLKVNDNKIEDNVENVLGNTEHVNVDQVENASNENGQLMREEEIMRRAGVKGGGVPGNIISAEQMAAIEDTIREIEKKIRRYERNYMKFEKYNRK